MKNVKKSLLVLIAAVMMVNTLFVPLFAATNDTISFIPVNPDSFGDHDATVNGVRKTIYCLQEDYKWPEATTEYKQADETDHKLLTKEQMEILRKIMYAGYPHNAEGILDECMDYPEYAALLTQTAIWEQLRLWGIEGNYEPVGEKAWNEDEPIIYELINFGNSGVSINPPKSNVITVSGSGVMTMGPDYVYRTGELMITEPENYKLTYKLTVPQGTKAVDKDGNEISEVKEGEKFFLTAEKYSDIPSSAELLVETTSSFPKDVEHYYPITKGDDNRPYQTMLCVGIDTMNLSGTLTISAVEKTVAVKKIWEDNDDAESKRPSSITVTLLADGEIAKDKNGDDVVVEISRSDRWNYIFRDLPKYNAELEEIEYTVIEEQVEGYDAPEVEKTPDGDFEITNTYTPETVTVFGVKTWDDKENEGNRPDTDVIIRLHADGTDTGKYVVISSEDNKEYEFTDLPKYKDGKEIVYTLTEDQIVGYIPEYIKVSEYEVNIHNTYNKEKIAINVEKVWDDSSDEDGLRPNSINVYLVKDGELTSEYVVLDASSNWEGEFTDLDYYKDDEKNDTYTYTVMEEQVEGYDEPVISGSQTTGYVITNTHIPETVTVFGVKTWDDNNIPGHRPASVRIRLHANGTVVDTKTISSADDQGYSFTDLPKYKDGKLIEYTVSEDSVLGYMPEYTNVSEYEININNVHHCEKVALTVSKTWDDKSDQDGIRPVFVKVNLLKNNVETGDYVILDESNGWEGEFTDLEYYTDDSHSETYRYTVEEERVPEGYTATVSGDQTKGYVITNQHEPETVTVSGTKTWDDKGIPDHRPAYITIRLHADGTAVDSRTISSTESTYEFTDLPKYKNGEPIKYTVSEDSVLGYMPEYTNASEYEININNEHYCELIAIPVSKVWDDNNNQDGFRPDEITVVLLRDGSPTDLSITLNKDNNWKGEFRELVYYKDDLHTDTYTYTVSEEKADHYDEPVISGNMSRGYTITNKHTPELTEVTVNKVWEDGSNNDGLRTAAVLQLYANCVEVYGKKVTVPVDQDEFTYTFTNLPKYKDGSEIMYMVIESVIPEGYQPSYSTDGFTVTNTHELEKITLDVKKVWEDGNNYDGVRPASVSITLYADGVVAKDDSGNEITVELNADNSWKHTFTDLLKYNAGIEIEYTVKETPVTGYSTTVSGNMTDGYLVKNHHDPHYPDVPKYVPPVTGVDR